MTPRTSSSRLRSLVSIEHVREPWTLNVDTTVLTVRGARPQDLPAVALMHGRCSAKSLLDRYRSGGRAPAVIILDRHVRDPLSFVVTTDAGRIVATARVAADATHPFGCGDAAMLVEDDWQQLGIGRSLLRHTAAAAALSGYRQLITYPGTTTNGVQRLLSLVGTTRLMSDVERHLHTSLPESARLGLGTLNTPPDRTRRVDAVGG
jgi:GNAT superfamily N-acetyltransferase